MLIIITNVWMGFSTNGYQWQIFSNFIVMHEDTHIEIFYWLLLILKIIQHLVKVTKTGDHDIAESDVKQQKSKSDQGLKKVQC